MGVGFTRISKANTANNTTLATASWTPGAAGGNAWVAFTSAAQEQAVSMTWTNNFTASVLALEVGGGAPAPGSTVGSFYYFRRHR